MIIVCYLGTTCTQAIISASANVSSGSEGFERTFYSLISLPSSYCMYKSQSMNLLDMFGNIVSYVRSVRSLGNRVLPHELHKVTNVSKILHIHYGLIRWSYIRRKVFFEFELQTLEYVYLNLTFDDFQMGYYTDETCAFNRMTSQLRNKRREIHCGSKPPWSIFTSDNKIKLSVKSSGKINITIQIHIQVSKYMNVGKATESITLVTKETHQSIFYLGPSGLKLINIVEAFMIQKLIVRADVTEILSFDINLFNSIGLYIFIFEGPLYHQLPLLYRFRMTRKYIKGYKKIVQSSTSLASILIQNRILDSKSLTGISNYIKVKFEQKKFRFIPISLWQVGKYRLLTTNTSLCDPIKDIVNCHFKVIKRGGFGPIRLHVELQNNEILATQNCLYNMFYIRSRAENKTTQDSFYLCNNFSINFMWPSYFTNDITTVYIIHYSFKYHSHPKISIGLTPCSVPITTCQNLRFEINDIEATNIALEREWSGPFCRISSFRQILKTPQKKYHFCEISRPDYTFQVITVKAIVPDQTGPCRVQAMLMKTTMSLGRRTKHTFMPPDEEGPKNVFTWKKMELYHAGVRLIFNSNCSYSFQMNFKATRASKCANIKTDQQHQMLDSRQWMSMIDQECRKVVISKEGKYIQSMPVLRKSNIAQVAYYYRTGSYYTHLQKLLYCEYHRATCLWIFDAHINKECLGNYDISIILNQRSVLHSYNFSHSFTNLDHFQIAFPQNSSKFVRLFVTYKRRQNSSLSLNLHCTLSYDIRLEPYNNSLFGGYKPYRFYEQNVHSLDLYRVIFKLPFSWEHVMAFCKMNPNRTMMYIESAFMEMVLKDRIEDDIVSSQMLNPVLVYLNSVSDENEGFTSKWWDGSPFIAGNVRDFTERNHSIEYVKGKVKTVSSSRNFSGKHCAAILWTGVSNPLTRIKVACDRRIKNIFPMCRLKKSLEVVNVRVDVRTQSHTVMLKNVCSDKNAHFYKNNCLLLQNGLPSGCENAGFETYKIQNKDRDIIYYYIYMVRQYLKDSFIVLFNDTYHRINYQEHLANVPNWFRISHFQYLKNELGIKGTLICLVYQTMETLSLHEYRQWLFPCADGSFISLNRICDNKFDCPDSSDEKDCDISLRQDLVYLCQDGAVIPATKRCNYEYDCQQKDDEADCIFESCDRKFRCSSGKCLPLVHRCDGFFHCLDGSDEEGCLTYGCEKATKTSPSHPLYKDTNADCNNVIHNQPDYHSPQKLIDSSSEELPQGKKFLSCQIGHPERFPSSKLCLLEYNSLHQIAYCKTGAHLKFCNNITCQGSFKCYMSYCVPLHYVCNGALDCQFGEDEEGCSGELDSCPGLYRCKTGACLHPSYYCDGTLHCPDGDDEKCSIKCPPNCTCLGQVMMCEFLDNIADLNFKPLMLKTQKIGLTQYSDTGMLSKVQRLDISNNSLMYIPTFVYGMQNLQILDISYNYIAQMTYQHLNHCMVLNASGNNMNVIKNNLFIHMTNLEVLILSEQSITEIKPDSFVGLDRVKKLDLRYNEISTLNVLIFQPMISLHILDLTGNNIITVQASLFSKLSSDLSIHIHSYSPICCMNVKTISCLRISHYETSVSCKLNKHHPRVLFVITIIGGWSILLNAVALGLRTMGRKANYHSVTVLHQIAADLLFSLSLSVIGSHELYSTYNSIMLSWPDSLWCHVLQCTTTVCIFVSTSLDVMISFDRYQLLIRPLLHLAKHQSVKDRSIILCVTWAFSTFIALLVNRYDKTKKYEGSRVCFMLHSTDNYLSFALMNYYIPVLMHIAVFIYILIIYKLVSKEDNISSKKNIWNVIGRTGGISFLKFTLVMLHFWTKERGNITYWIREAIGLVTWGIMAIFNPIAFTLSTIIDFK